MKRCYFSLLALVVTILAVFFVVSSCGNKDDEKETPAEAGIKKAQELCDCFKKSSDEEGMACAESLHAKYIEYEDDADFEGAFHQELVKCDTETPEWW